MGAMGQVHGTTGGGGAAIGVVARRSIDVILINVTKLLVHSIAIQ